MRSGTNRYSIRYNIGIISNEAVRIRTRKWPRYRDILKKEHGIGRPLVLRHQISIDDRWDKEFLLNHFIQQATFLEDLGRHSQAARGSNGRSRSTDQVVAPIAQAIGSSRNNYQSSIPTIPEVAEEDLSAVERTIRRTYQ